MCCICKQGVVTIAGASGTPSTFAFAVVKDVEITVSADHVPLWGWGSIFRVAVAKHQQKVPVKVGSMKFNPGGWAGSSLAWWAYITDPVAGSGTNVDTNTVKLFNIKATFTFEDGQILSGTVYNVYFPNLPIRASEGQWIKLDMSGEGAYILWDDA